MVGRCHARAPTLLSSPPLFLSSVFAPRPWTAAYLPAHYISPPIVPDPTAAAASANELSLRSELRQLTDQVQGLLGIFKHLKQSGGLTNQGMVQLDSLGLSKFLDTCEGLAVPESPPCMAACVQVSATNQLSVPRMEPRTQPSAPVLTWL